MARKAFKQEDPDRWNQEGNPIYDKHQRRMKELELPERPQRSPFHFNLPFLPGAWLGRLIAFLVRLPWRLMAL